MSKHFLSEPEICISSILLTLLQAVVVVLVLGEEPQYIMQLAEWQFVLEILGWEWDILFRFFVVFFGAFLLSFTDHHLG